MIFIFIFVTMSVTFCNSFFIHKGSNTHLIVLSDLGLDVFKEMWIHELPNEVIQQRSRICQLLIEPIIIKDSSTFLAQDYYSVHLSFANAIDGIAPLEEHMDEPFLFEQNGHRIHLLPCQRDRQTIYITKLYKYKSYIMLANQLHFNGDPQLLILGFIMKFAELNPIGEKTLEFLYDTFKNHIINEKRGKKEVDLSPMPVYYNNEQNFEYRIQSIRLCISVLRQSATIGIAIYNLPVNAPEYLLNDFPIARNTSSRLSVLRLEVIQCKYRKFKYDLIKHTSTQLFVMYYANNRKSIELFKAEDRDTILLLESAFAHVVNK